MVRRDELLPPRDEGRPSRRCTEASGAWSIRGPIRAARFRPRPCGIRRNLARCFEGGRAYPEFRSCPIAPRGKAAHGTVVEHARGRIEDAPRTHVGSDARSVRCDQGDRVVPRHVLTSPRRRLGEKYPTRRVISSSRRQHAVLPSTCSRALESKGGRRCSRYGSRSRRFGGTVGGSRSSLSTRVIPTSSVPSAWPPQRARCRGRVASGPEPRSALRLVRPSQAEGIGARRTPDAPSARRPRSTRSGSRGRTTPGRTARRTRP